MFPRHAPLARFTKTAIGSAAAAAALIAASAPAFAGDRASHQTRSVEVSFTDLDLSTDAGAEALENRIRYAARAVCSPAPTKQLADKVDHMTCVKNAKGEGRTAMVTLIAKAKNGNKFAADERVQIGN